MANKGLTVFSWGYEGWGNWTDKLVEVTEAVEKSRGRKPPLFVDIRASRKVRAVGFREHAFERRFGPDRYRWLKGLGNKAIITDAEYGEFVDPSAIDTLLDLVIEMDANKRRVIFFCSCASPNEDCHRHWVAPALLKVAKKRGQPLTVVEWPGFEDEDGKPPDLKLSSEAYQSVLRRHPASLPLGEALPAERWLTLSWWTPVRLVSGDQEGWIVGGPAQYRAGGWQLPVASGSSTPAKTRALLNKARKAMRLLPTAWPPDEPSQEAAPWQPM
jgi:hypothetical protein